MSALRGTLLFGIGVVVVVFALLVTLLYFGQRRVLFPGSRAFGTVEPETLGGERIWLAVDGARSEAWLLPPRAGTSGGPLLLYAHGNGELIDHWVEAFEPARARGATTLLVEYPGYGRSSGSPSARSIRDTMAAAYDFAVRERGFAGRPIVGWGRSLGGGAVCALARERALAALVLESTFTSVTEMARLFGVPGWLAPWLVRDHFDNLRVVRGFEGPVLVLHGERDEIVPASEGRALGSSSSRAELHLLPCGHNDCERPWPLVLDFLRAHGLL
jgi:pimeloyl-ACP methyl ester carboxylesterase